YGASVVPVTTKTAERQLEQVQRRFTRIAFRRAFPTSPMPSYTQRLSMMDLRSLVDRRCISSLLLAKK
ncbi:hypothetical protein AAVH_33934, partial [Aphelenchoides avenae]